MKGQGLAPLPEWELDVMSFPEPTPVVYSDKACRCCGGATVEGLPGVVVACRGFLGEPEVWVRSHRFWCDKCEVVTWTRV